MMVVYNGLTSFEMIHGSQQNQIISTQASSRQFEQHDLRSSCCPLYTMVEK